MIGKFSSNFTKMDGLLHPKMYIRKFQEVHLILPYFIRMKSFSNEVMGVI